MLYYLDRPVPSNIQAYLQSFDSPHLTYKDKIKLAFNEQQPPPRRCKSELSNREKPRRNLPQLPPNINVNGETVHETRQLGEHNLPVRCHSAAFSRDHLNNNIQFHHQQSSQKIPVPCKTSSKVNYANDKYNSLKKLFQNKSNSPKMPVPSTKDEFNSLKKSYENKCDSPKIPVRCKSATFIRSKSRKNVPDIQRTSKVPQRAKSATFVREPKRSLTRDADLNRSYADLSSNSRIPRRVDKGSSTNLAQSYPWKSIDLNNNGYNVADYYHDDDDTLSDFNDSSLNDSLSILSLSTTSSVFTDNLNMSMCSTKTHLGIPNVHNNNKPRLQPRPASAPGFREKRKSKIPISRTSLKNISDMKYSNFTHLNQYKQPNSPSPRPLSSRYSSPRGDELYDNKTSAVDSKRNDRTTHVDSRRNDRSYSSLSFAFNSYMCSESHEDLFNENESYYNYPSGELIPSSPHYTRQSDGSYYSDTVSSTSFDFSSSNINVVETVQDYEEIVLLLQKDQSGAKRDGLVSLQAFLHGLKSMTQDEAVHIKNIFNRYFAEQNSKIYSLFLDVLSEFIVQYRNDLHDWLFILLTRLLQRISTDTLPSSQTKIARVLDIVRDSYPYDHQFQIITKYITDNTQTPTLKMKVALLQYLLGLVALMDASDFMNTGPIRLAISKIITWISEPKSADVRKEASSVIVALFQLNTPEFTTMLSNLPNSIQEGATRVIQMNMKHDTLLNNHSEQENVHYNDRNTYHTKRDERPSYRTPLSNKKPHNHKEEHNTPYSPYRPSSRQDTDGAEASSPSSKIPVRHKLSYDGGDQAPVTPAAYGIPSSSSTPYTYATHYDSDGSPMWLSKDNNAATAAGYNPKQYEDTVLSHHNGTYSPSDISRVGDGAEQPDGEETSSQGSVNLVNQVFTVLSGPQTSNDSEDIKSALLELLKMIRGANKQLLGPRMKTFLPLVLSLLKHKEATIRCLAARSLREIASTQPDAYRRDLKAFILPLLETEADSQKEVAKTAEECCTIASQNLPANEVLPVVAPLVGGAPYPTNHSAIKMLHVIADNSDSYAMKNHLEVVVPNLLRAYDHEESSVRKAAVFCLVAVHNVAGGEYVQPYFKNLAGSKMKLLNLYIRRSQSANV